MEKASKTKEGEVMILQLLETEPDQLMKIGGIVWGMTGAAIGSILVFITIIGFLLNFVPGMPNYPMSGVIYLLFMSIVITFVFTVFYSLTGAALGGMLANTVNWVLNKMGGIKLKVRKLNFE